ncbi:MAG: GNAT family N-acetyltransferase [Vampirovibrionales bacterium]
MNKTNLLRVPTPRLILRALKDTDVQRVYQIASHPKVNASVAILPVVYTQEDAVAWVARSQAGFQTGQEYLWGIEHVESKRLIGHVGLHRLEDTFTAELGYWLDARYWGKGYASEVVSAVLSLAKHQLVLCRVVATTARENHASRRVLETHGFVWLYTACQAVGLESERWSHYFERML